MDTTRIAAAVAADQRLFNFYLIIAPEHTSAMGQLTPADQEAAIALSPRLRTLGLPPYVIVHGRDPSSVAVMTALRLRGAKSLTGGIAEPLPLPARMLCTSALNERLSLITGTECAEGSRVREMIISSLLTFKDNGEDHSILLISPLPARILCAIGVTEEMPLSALNVIQAQLDQDGRACSATNLGSLE